MSTASLLHKIDLCVQDRKFYEAAQLFRTCHRRYITNKNFDEDRLLLLRGITQLASVDPAAAAQLAELLIQNFSLSKQSLECGYCLISTHLPLSLYFPLLTKSST